MPPETPLFKRLILHIGSHKTGTSAVQRAADDHRNTLLEQGLLYPKTGQWHDKSHHKWTFALWDEASGPETLERLIAELKAERDLLEHQADTILLSSEIIEKVPLNPKLVRTLVSLLSQIAEEIECIYFVRRQDLLLESVFKQWVKDANIRLSDPYAGFINSQKSKMDYLEVAQTWENLPKVTRMLVRTNALVREPRAAFFETANLQVPPVPSDKNRIVNPTLDGAKLELKYFLNRLPMEQDQDNAVMTMINRIDTEKEILALFSDEARLQLMEEFRPKNDQLATQYEVEPFDETMPERSRMIAPLTGRMLHALMEQMYEEDRKLTWLIFNKIRKQIESR
jgi:hypothetical protein